MEVDASGLAAPELAAALFDLHAASAVGDETDLRFERNARPTVELLAEGAGFEVVTVRGGRARLRRLRTLADTVRPGMRLLVIGLNPSLYSADAGIGYFKAGNRFWPAALASGLVSRDRDPRHALEHHGVGMTDFVKRATPAVAEVGAEEFAHGVERVSRVVELFAPAALCVVGLAGWRAAVDRRAVAGVQDVTIGGRAVYLMPSTSGLNAHSQVPDLAAHFRAAMALADEDAGR